MTISNQERNALPAPRGARGAPDIFALTDTAFDYELSVWVQFNFNDYRRGADGAWPAAVSGSYVLAAGREDGRWRLETNAVLGVDADGEEIVAEPPLVELRDQEGQPDPLALLLALLTGGRRANQGGV